MLCGLPARLACSADPRRGSTHPVGSAEECLGSRRVGSRLFLTSMGLVSRSPGFGSGAFIGAPGTSKGAWDRGCGVALRRSSEPETRRLMPALQG